MGVALVTVMKPSFIKLKRKEKLFDFFFFEAATKNTDFLKSSSRALLEQPHPLPYILVHPLCLPLFLQQCSSSSLSSVLGHVLRMDVFSLANRQGLSMKEPGCLEANTKSRQAKSKWQGQARGLGPQAASQNYKRKSGKAAAVRNSVSVAREA